MIGRLASLRGVSLATLLIVAGGGASLRAQQEWTHLDGFETANGWSPAPAPGVSLELSTRPGYIGNALRLEFDFQGGAGYAIARKAFDATLPEDYEFSFWIRGQSLPNNFEFKLVDESGENVWWSNRRNFEFPQSWTQVRIRRRHVEFAWGPTTDRVLRRVAAIEFVVTAGSGGKGWIELDEFELRSVPPRVGPPPVMAATASSMAPGAAADRAIDRDPQTGWQASSEDPQPTLTLDFGAEREFGGLTLWWGPGGFPRRYRIDLLNGDGSWGRAWQVDRGLGGRADVFLPESTARGLRLVVEAAGPHATTLAELQLRSVEEFATRTAMFEVLARESPRGRYPRSLSGEQVYWTVVGVERASEEALFSEDGVVEILKGGPSLEPFLAVDDAFIDWSSAAITSSLDEGFLPIPTATWHHARAGLSITAVAEGPGSASRLHVRYRVSAPPSSAAQGTLYVVLRPFQVNPPQQFLNLAGGAAKISEIEAKEGVLRVDGAPRIRWGSTPVRFGASPFAEGNVVPRLAAGSFPELASAADPFGAASGVIAYPFDLQPDQSQDLVLEVLLAPAGGSFSDATFEAVLDGARQHWTKRLTTVEITGSEPVRELGRSLRAALAQILVHLDGAAIQPGSRSYERSWIRDGSLTSSALLRFGFDQEVAGYLRWFAGFLSPDGRVPCCVDLRGADPVVENDSGGEFLFLAAEYLRMTGDLSVASDLWPRIESVVEHLDRLRQERRTPAYRAPALRRYFGLLPESISHEGYSAKPMHSYWDDFFALRGFKDAVDLANALGHPDEATTFASWRDEFRLDLYASLAATMAATGVTYLPGCAELGDFDPTSTTVAIAPGGELQNLPAEAVKETYDRYVREASARADGTAPWEAFTPYEVRIVGTLTRLGRSREALSLLDFLLSQRRPSGFRQWSEVVYHEARDPHFIGDMPHGWVASDFVRSVLDLFAFERESDGALVLGSGVPPEWLDSPDGMRIRGLRTHYGRLGWSATREASGVRVSFELDGRLPPGGVVLTGPLATAVPGGEVRFDRLFGSVLLKEVGK